MDVGALFFSGSYTLLSFQLRMAAGGKLVCKQFNFEVRPQHLAVGPKSYAMSCWQHAPSCDL